MQKQEGAWLSPGFPSTTWACDAQRPPRSQAAPQGEAARQGLRFEGSFPPPSLCLLFLGPFFGNAGPEGILWRGAGAQRARRG